MTVADVKQIILDSTDPIAALDGITVSGGRLNAFAALSMTGIPGTHSIEIDWDQNVTDVNFGNREILAGSISGYKWHDIHADGVWDSGEVALSDWTIYIDTNGNGALDGGEVSTVTDADGAYSFSELYPGGYTIVEVLQAGWQLTFPSGLDHYVMADGSRRVGYRRQFWQSDRLCTGHGRSDV